MIVGLLAKADDLRNRLHLGNGAPEGIVFDSESGISQEDQREILKEIEKVATQSRMQVSPELFAVRAVKRGVLFPILSNLLTIFLAGAAIASFYFLFQKNESQISVGQPASIAVESDIIERMKKDAEEKLKQKNQEIDQIQGRLSEINKEKEALQSSMDAKVSQREKELRAAMDAELAAERERLSKQGLSEQDIAARLANLETQKNSDFTRQLDAYKRQAQEERAKSEAALKSLETEFSANLARANTEKEQAAAEAAKREEELKKHSEQKTQAAEAAKTQAERALSSLTEQKQREDAAADQLISLYETVKTDIRERNFDKALSSLQAVNSFVGREDIAGLPGMVKRRGFDLFVIDSLGSLVRSESETVRTDTSALVAATNQVSEIRALVREADNALKAGKVEDAEKSYAKALEVMPEVQKSYAYLMQKEKAAEALRQTRLREGLAKAEASFSAGKPAEALDLYRAAFTAVPDMSDRVEKMLSNIQAVGLELGLQKNRQEQSRAAAPLFTQAQSMNAEGSYDDAIAQYIQVLARYPLIGSDERISDGIRTAVNGLKTRSSSGQRESEGTLNAEIASLKQQITARQSDVSRMKRYITDLIGESGDPDAMEVGAVLDSLGASYARRSGTGSGADTDLADSLTKAREENAKLLTRIDGLTEENAKFLSQIEGNRKENADLLSQSEAVKASLAKAEAENANLLSQIDALKADLTKTRDEKNAELQTQIDAVKASLAKAEAENANLLSQIDALKADLTKSRDEKNAELQTQIDAVKASLAKAETENANLLSQIDGLKKENADLLSQVNALKASLAKAEAENAKLLTQIDGLKTDLTKAGQAEAAGQELVLLRQQNAELQEKQKKQEEELSKKDKELADKTQALQQRQETAALSQAEAQRLKTLTDRFSALDKSYKSYTALEDPAVASLGMDALVDTKPYLDSFLGSKAVEETFPGLLARIKRYDQGFQAVGRTDALQDVLDIAIGSSQAKTEEDKKKFFEKKLREYKNDAEMTALLKRLQDIL